MVHRDEFQSDLSSKKVWWSYGAIYTVVSESVGLKLIAMDHSVNDEVE